MNNIIKDCMTFNTYPKHEMYWQGYEYLPKTDEERKKFLDAVGFSFYEEEEFMCLQAYEDGSRFVLAVGCFVEDISESQMVEILKKIF
jgi:hypothetical protein